MENQKARPLVVFGIMIVPALFVALLYFGFFSKKERLTDKVAGTQIEANVSVSSVSPAKVIAAPTFVSAPEDDGGIAPETRAALEKAGLHDVQLSPLAFSVQARKPVIVGSALPNSAQR